jgi:Domain of unknown function (DUF4440)
MSQQDELLGIERLLWKNDPALYRENYTSDALITFAETGVIDVAFAVEAIRQENAEGRRWAEVAFDDVRTVQVTDEVTLLLYKATARWAHETEPIQTLCTTVYVWRDGRWKAAHHQQSQLGTRGDAARAATTGIG